MARYPGFVGPSYTLSNTIAADDECINRYPSKVESGTGPAQYTLEPVPGFTAYVTLPEAPTRGFFTLNGATFGVGGENLYEITSIGTAILRATGLSNLNNQLVSFACNGDAGHQMALVSDSTLYCFDLITNTLTEVDDITSTDVVFQDGYFISLNPNTSTINQSELLNGLVYDEAAQRNDTPDKWVRMMARPKEIWLHGSQTTSVYFNADQEGVTFAPNPSVAIAWGTGAPESVALLNGSPCWLANDLTVRYAAGQGYSPVRISTHAMEWQIAQYDTVLDADAFTYVERGHAFYVLNFPSAGVTWVYDLLTGLWHKRGSWVDGAYGVLPVWGYTYAFGKHLVGDRVSGVVYEMSSDVFVDTTGDGMRWMRRAPHLVKELKRANYFNFELHMEVGVGLPSGQGSDPKVMLRWSNDGGQSFGNVLESSIGRIGAYTTRVRWPGALGQARDRVFEASGSDPVPYRIVDALLDVRQGTS